MLHESGFLNNLQHRELFLRYNGLESIDYGVSKIDAYIRNNKEMLENLRLEGDWYYR